MKLTRYFFRKSQRIVAREDFDRVLSRKCFICKGMLRLYAAENELDRPRFGVSVSKTCGSAVARNRLKRFAREAFRLHQHEIPPNFDYILIITQKKPNKRAKNGKMSDVNRFAGQFQDIESTFLTMIQALAPKMGC